MRHITAAAVSAACAAALAVLPVSAADIGSIEINVADRGWIVQYWGSPDESTGIASRENAEITGNGDYTASVTFENSLGDAAFLALCSDIDADDMPEGMEVRINSVSVDGKNVEFGINGSPDWKEQNGRMCVNIVNSWTGNEADIAADPQDFDGAENVTVSFSVSGLPEEEENVLSDIADDADISETEPEKYIPPSDDIIGMSDETENTVNADTGDGTASLMIAAAVSGALALIMRKKHA